jgi:dihydroorotase-like cyclic amidohydrolase
LIAHLLLDDRAYERHGNLAMVNPPIREREHVDALWAGLRAGEIDLVATDHAPHTLDEQMRDDVWQGVGGFGGVELLLPLLLTQAAEGRLALEDAVRLTSQGPARVYGLYPRKGSLAIGSDADFALVDLDAAWTVDQASLHAKHRVSPFHGETLKGRPVGTYVRGCAVMREGELTGSPSGRLVRPGVG